MILISFTTGLMAAAETTGNDAGNLALGLLIGAIGLVCGSWWIAHRFQAGRRRAGSREEHEMLREINELRPEQKAVERMRPRLRLRRGGF